MIKIQEDDLHAYVDNQLSADKVEAVEALMRKDPNIAEQVLEWQKQNNEIAKLFENRDFTEIPDQLNLEKLKKKPNKKLIKTEDRQRKSTPWFYSMAASLFLMVISGSIGWFAHDLSQPLSQNTKNFVNSAISAHEVYSVEVLHPVEVKANQKDHLVAWLSKRINHTFTAPNLKEYNYSLLGGRLLAMKKGKPGAQLMYENPEGKRVTLLISKNKTYHDQSFHLKKVDNINAFYWMDSKVAYSLTGEVNSKFLRDISTSIYQQLIEKKPKQLVLHQTNIDGVLAGL